jgi:hypothetical protein
MSGSLFNFLDGIEAAEIAVDVDRRSQSALATLTVDDQVRWSVSIWLDGREIEGFIVREHAGGIELVVRNLAALDSEPALARLVAAVCQAGELTVPSAS